MNDYNQQFTRQKNRISVYLTFTLMVLLLFSCGEREIMAESKSIIIEGETGELLDSILTPYVEELREITDNTAGLAIGITKGEKIIYARTFGYANVEKEQKADLNTAFHIASISKPFSAIAIAKLIQQNKLNLDDKIVDHIPQFKMAGNGYNEITIAHILTHTSGIPRHIAIDDWLNPSYGPKAMEENLDIVKDQELDFEPGTKFSYSNSAFDILGIVIARASGLSFDEYISKHVLEPAGMLNSNFKKTTEKLPENWAAAHSYGLETQEWSPFPYNERLFPSSGMVSSVLDMCRWGLIHNGKGNYKDYQVLDEEHYNLIISPKYDTPWGDKIGLAWFLQSYMDRPIIMHTGSDTGFESMFYVYPEDEISISILGNRDFSRAGRIVNAASEIIFGKEPKDYTISAKYQFVEKYKKDGLEKAIELWSEMKTDTSDMFYVDNGDILTTGAILENGGKWEASKDILEYYLTLNQKSTYAWRLLGNCNLNLRDTITAKSCYEQTLEINPDYEKGKIALEKLADN